MADFENVAGIRGAKLSDLAEHVNDVLELVLDAEDEYQVGKLALESYDFVPYALSGLAAAMQTPTTGARAATHVTVPISDDKGGSDKADRDVTLFGPGDVLGVDPAQIARRYPTPGSTNAEETFHAHIEFDRPELPWAFSAHTAGDQMPPWLALVVFELDEVEWEPAQTGLQPVVSVAASTLPPLASAWAWAHAQATSGTASLTARLSTAYAPVNVSRLLAARVLTQDTNYVACLVPTTDVGRRAGLGLPGGTLGPAWTPQDGTVRLPVFDRWEFRTAPDGDFARLARRLKGVAAPWEIGRRIMDASRPGDPLADLGMGDAGRRQVIKCALFSLAPRPAGAPDDAARWSAARTQELKGALERPAVVEGTAGKDPGVVPDLPIIGPRIYAKGQRGTTTVPTGDWFADLNLAPTNRVVGGLGTRVVAKDQEELMQAAWAQVGEIEKTNRELALAELARHLANSLHARLAEVEHGRLLQLARPLASRVRLDGGLTLAGQIARSATPDSALSGAFRRGTRTTGPIARRLAPAERASVRQVVGDTRGLRDFTRAYANPDGIEGLSDEALQSLDPAALSAALHVPQPEALAAIKSATTRLSRGETLATAVTTPARWREPNLEFRPGVAATERIATAIRDRAAADRGRHVVASRWLGGLAAGLAVTQVEGTAELHEVAVTLEKRVTATAGHVRVPQPPIVAREVPTPSTAALILRSGAARGAREARSELSGRAAGSLLGSITRPTAASNGDASERERLDRFRTPQATVLATWAERAAQVSVLDVRAELSALINAPAALALAETPQRNTLNAGKQDILLRLDPNRTVVDAMRARLDTGALSFDAFAGGLIRPIMAAPRFNRPMYEALDAYGREWLVPGLGKLPEPELVTVLSANDEFIEAFLVGLSDEMGRELLWREYPTDARGTYFYRFWEPDKDELSEQIHRFAPSKLGSHVTLGPPGESGIAVVVIRGEVVRRYPDLTVMALHEQGSRDDQGRPNLPEAPTGPPDAVASLFHAMLPPDIMLAGLDITVDTLREPGWWIVLAEHPQATRFRRQEPDLAGHEVVFATVAGNATGATVAHDRLEDPTRIAFEAGDFLPPL